MNDGNLQLQSVGRAEWSTLLSGFSDADYRHYWSYSNRVADRVGAEVEYLKVDHKDKVLGLAAVRIKSIPLVGPAIAYVSGGPVTQAYGAPSSPDNFINCLKTLVQEYVERRGLTLRIQPPLQIEDTDETILNGISALGFRNAAWPKPYRTHVIHLEKELADIRRGFHQKWRNCLNSAERNEMEFTWGMSRPLFDRIGHMIETLETQKGFQSCVDATLLAEVNSCCIEDMCGFTVGLAEIGSEPVAGIVTSCFADTAIYLLGASAPAGREQKAAYLLQWQAMQRSKAAGARYYDLGGIDPEGNPGVYQFKARMGGVERCAIGPIECWPNQIRGASLRTGELLYRLTGRHRR